MPAEFERLPIPKKDFFFLRHGQTDWNVQGRFQGHTDIPLNATGLAQAEAAAEAVANCGVDLIIASPLIRARTTAEIVAARLGKAPEFDKDLMERRFGRFEGLVVNEVKATLGLKPDERLVRHLPEDAEQWQETRARTARVFGKWLIAHPDASILFVSHSGLFDALHEMIFGARIEPKHAPYRWSHGDSGWQCDLL
jgi:broad specificity phosphatase PhoE